MALTAMRFGLGCKCVCACCVLDRSQSSIARSLVARQNCASAGKRPSGEIWRWLPISRSPGPMTIFSRWQPDLRTPPNRAKETIALRDGTLTPDSSRNCGSKRIPMGHSPHVSKSQLAAPYQAQSRPSGLKRLRDAQAWPVEPPSPNVPGQAVHAPCARPSCPCLMRPTKLPMPHAPDQAAHAPCARPSCPCPMRPTRLTLVRVPTCPLELASPPCAQPSCPLPRAPRPCPSRPLPVPCARPSPPLTRAPGRAAPPPQPECADV